MKRGATLWLFAMLSLFQATQASAGLGPVPFSDPVFARAQTEGRTVVVETYASWCLPCRIQSPILERLLSREQFKDFVILRIGEQTPGSVWKRFRLHGYGNLIVFKGAMETSRGTPTTEPDILALLSFGR